MKSPGFTSVAVLTLALGIGACTAIFSLFDTVLLRPLPYPDGERIMLVQQRYKGTQDIPFSWANFWDVHRDNHSFAALGIVSRSEFTLSAEQAVEKVRGGRVSSEFFRVLAVNPIVGRTFSADEDQPGTGKVAVLRESLWRRDFGGRRDVIGQSLTLDGQLYTIIGVLPNDVITPGKVEFWIPIAPFSSSPDWQKRGNQPGLFAYGRLKAGVTVDEARADLRMIGERLQHDFPTECAETLPVATPLLETLVSSYRPALWMLMGAVSLLLAIACANVGSLQLARTLDRTHEFALRAALGSSRGRLIRQVLSENLVLFLIGGAAGVLLAYWSLDAIKAFCPPSARFQSISVNQSVLLFSLGATVLSALFFGLWPALRAARTDLRESLQTASKGVAASSSQWTRQTMVAAQVALTVLLVAGAGLFARSLAQMQKFQFGFDAQNLLVFTVSVSETQGAYKDDAKRIALFEAVKAQLKTLPGVRSVGYNLSLPLRTQWSTFFDIAGRESFPPGSEPAMEMGVIDADYFNTLGVRVKRGRAFDNALDKAGANPRIIIDERMAKAFWPNEDPVGKLIYRGRAANRSGDDAKPTEIVGVVPTLALYGTDEPPPNCYQAYLPQSQVAVNEINFVLRTAVAPLSLEKSARAAVAAVDPNVPVYAVDTMERMIATSHQTQALYSRLVAFFAGVALLLACLGLHGVVAHAMSARRRELGIRMALGALPRQIVSLVLRQGITPLAIGLALGLVGSVAVRRLIAGLLYNVSAGDPLVLASTVTLLFVVGLITLWRPALRATRINPMIALRDE
ncbi:MAG: ABC transporter permease [Chthoniobacterales bacterium]